RKKLRDALTRRGVTLPAGVLAVVAGQGVLAPEVVAQVTKASRAFARGEATAGLVADSPVRLAKGELAMGSTRTWVAVLGLTVAALAATAGFAFTDLAPTDPPQPAPITAAEGTPKPVVADDAKPRSDMKPDAKGEAWGPARKLGTADGMVYAV